MFWRQRPTTATARAHARAALVGNPSDGYGGRTVAFAFRELYADVKVTDSPRLVIDAERGEGALLRAAYGRFVTHCIDAHADPRPCRLSVSCNIPLAVGLSGARAIVTAALRALAEFNAVPVDELGLPDDGLVFTDFMSPEGRNARLEPSLMKHSYIAWWPRLAAKSTFHDQLGDRFRAGDPEVLTALAEMAELAERARDAFERADLDAVEPLIDANFDLRRRLGGLEPHHVRMVEVARAAGASANYAGRGGAITGFARGQHTFAELSCALAALGCTVIRPTVAV